MRIVDVRQPNAALCMTQTGLGSQGKATSNVLRVPNLAVFIAHNMSSIVSCGRVSVVVQSSNDIKTPKLHLTCLQLSQSPSESADAVVSALLETRQALAAGNVVTWLDIPLPDLDRPAPPEVPTRYYAARALTEGTCRKQSRLT